MREPGAQRQGTERRIAAVQRTLTDFGVATECGMGRRPPETILDLLSIHSAVAALGTD